MGYTKEKLGIDYAACTELYKQNEAGVPVVTDGLFAQTDKPLYGGQLPPATGPSITWRLFRSKVGPETFTPPASDACRFQLTYYVRFRGTKGNRDLE